VIDVSLETPINIRRFQRKLYTKAKQEPSYRFYCLYDKICREDILAHAYEMAKANGGVPGMDIRDRVVQTATKLVIEPIFEADLEPNAYGYRPKRSARDAVQKVDQLLRVGYTDVVDADLSKYLDTASYCPLIHESCSNSGGC
jgi:RNA-directed DNA polymerase